VRCAVGDKYVMEEMIARGLSLGGEQSGHVIFSDYLFTGDDCARPQRHPSHRRDGRTLAELASDLVSYPQVLLNVRVREKKDLASVPAVRRGDRTRRIARRRSGPRAHSLSGTEPLLRVMLEGQNQDDIRAWHRTSLTSSAGARLMSRLPGSQLPGSSQRPEA